MGTLDHFYLVGGPPPWKTSPQEEGWMNVKQVAKYLGISCGRVYVNIRKRVIHSMGFQVYQMPSPLQSKRRIFLRQILKNNNVFH